MLMILTIRGKYKPAKGMRLILLMNTNYKYSIVESSQP